MRYTLEPDLSENLEDACVLQRPLYLFTTAPVCFWDKCIGNRLGLYAAQDKSGRSFRPIMSQYSVGCHCFKGTLAPSGMRRQAPARRRFGSTYPRLEFG